MTREEAITLMDELLVCIKEHPIIAEWLVEIAGRKTEPTSSKMEQVDEPQTCSVNGRPYTDCCNCEYFKCTADEPQTDCPYREYPCDVCDEQTDCPWK